ncbi:hypothetical protein [Xenorhabdus anantnagensis]|uniref:Uncharacterized protein n=1 Tax=Xenorhabdus anantnagensis TaxID=3025875 RepID=A0ABT5LMR8_9GAMM|nr:hypothetical protein [Xenorhabdus anantnagensis]MDC9595702.1 hypothetical protein [Xenorhabdus anantnagensis]
MKNNFSIDENSISIYFEKDFFQILEHDVLPPDGDCIKAIALVRDKEGTPLPNVSVAIIEKEHAYFDHVNIYHSDKETPVRIQKIVSNLNTFIITSNNNGELIFYVYPKKLTPLIFQVDSMVINVTGRISSKNKIYIIDNNKEDLTLPPPDILGDDGKLWVNPSSNFFTLLIQDYPDAKINDTILFFIDNKYVNKFFVVEDISALENSYMTFPYNLLTKNKSVNFSYTIVNNIGLTRSSTPKSITYSGGAYNQPTANLERTYDSCIVYSSDGDSDDKNMVNTSIVEKDIAHRCKNSHHEGLFVKIIGTSDHKDKTKVPFGAEVILNLYVNNYPNTVYQSKLKLMPSQPDSHDSNTATLLFGIPFNYVGHIDNGEIYFDFQVNYYGDISYGQIWQASLHTVRPGGELPGDACPDGVTWSGIW